MAALKLKGSGSSLQNLPLVAKVAIGVVFALLVGAAYFVIFYGEIESDIASQQQRLTQLEKELVEVKEARKAFNRDLAEVKRREALVKKQKMILPDEAESPAFLQTVQNVASVSGVNLTSWTPLDESVEEFYAKVPMQLTLSGKFHQVARFFYGIGQADRIINMENIHLKARRVAAKKTSKETKSIVLDDAQLVAAECLATAFRALKSDEAGTRRGKGKKGRKGKKGKPTPRKKGGAK